MKFVAKNIEDLADISEQLVNRFKHQVILFYGEMGAGKTTLIKNLCLKMGVKDTTSSPTFSIVNEYKTSNNQIVYHFDFYRLKNETEALDLGYEDYFYSTNFCFVEWPEKIQNLLPEKNHKIHIAIDNLDNRIIHFE